MDFASSIRGFAFILSFSLDPKLLEVQAVTPISSTAGSVYGLGMEGDKYKANDLVLDVPRDPFLHRGLSGCVGSWGVPVPSALG